MDTRKVWESLTNSVSFSIAAIATAQVWSVAATAVLYSVNAPNSRFNRTLKSVLRVWRLW
eukprot:10961657-Heterocapsa_arctica.AAC.1